MNAANGFLKSVPAAESCVRRPEKDISGLDTYIQCSMGRKCHNINASRWVDRICLRRVQSNEREIGQDADTPQLERLGQLYLKPKNDHQRLATSQRLACGTSKNRISVAGQHAEMHK
jgi:hypothetical protein